MPNWLPVTIAALSVLVSLGMALYVARSGPIASHRLLKDLIDRVHNAEGNVDALALKWQQFREGIDGMLEELESTADRVERGRRRTAQAAARLKRRENGEAPEGEHFDPSALEPADLRRFARSRGFPV